MKSMEKTSKIIKMLSSRKRKLTEDLEEYNPDGSYSASYTYQLAQLDLINEVFNKLEVKDKNE